MRKKNIFLLLLMLIFSLSFLSGAAMAEDMKLEIGIMPAVDSAPILLAKEKGYFAEEGLDIKIDVYTNAVNRQTALQTNELDGAMTDLIAFVNNVNNGFPVKITTSTDGSFPILVTKGFEEKEEVNIGMMEVSVSNFLSEQFLGDKYKLNKTFIPAIPARLEMVKSGQLEMAVIPEPLASTAELQGLEKRVYKNEYDFMPEAMIFTEKALKEKDAAIQAFHNAYNKAVKEIQQDDSQAREVLIKSLDLPAKIKNLIAMPQYHLTRVPSEDYLNRVISWIEKTDDSEIEINYNQVIEGKYSIQ
ncbi:ABC transporter substrate-binding protein [Halanaerobium kushneri]|jgi:NitT/TauT family transport system substrate-binding protein|uniref:NitT/TauT family transport system substrate-binding protein n=1 Tax=Halanaerobium kushneri TaxID=56779 RepID=A0A1N6VJR5_9FIRM|nr:ABC transporter substrate-binding protein [Halanaerobium kushneri]SIQ78071.1 NitT/TauT family transport system substrate-binding protein [Halanaerobium kushneri]